MKSDFSNTNSFQEVQTSTFSFYFVMILDPSNSKKKLIFWNCWGLTQKLLLWLQGSWCSKYNLQRHASPKGIPYYSPENSHRTWKSPSLKGNSSSTPSYLVYNLSFPACTPPKKLTSPLKTCWTKNKHFPFESFLSFFRVDIRSFSRQYPPWNLAPENRPKAEGLVFQPPFFWGGENVSFREG